MKLSCPSCSQPIAGADIDLGRGVAVCRACGEIFPLPNSSALVPVRPTEALALYRPADMKWQERFDGEDTTVLVRHARGRALFTLPFLIVWFAFLAFWYAAALTSGNLVMMLFPLLHVAVGLFVAWTTARLFNTVQITIGADGLRMAEGPVPVPRSRFTISDPMLRGFEVSSHHESSKRGPVARLSVCTADGTATRLPLSFEDPTHAAYARDRLTQLLDETRQRRLLARESEYRD